MPALGRLSLNEAACKFGSKISGFLCAWCTTPHAMQGLSTPLAAPAGTALLSTSTCGPRRAPAALCFIVLIILSFLQLHFNSLE